MKVITKELLFLLKYGLDVNKQTAIISENESPHLYMWWQVLMQNREGRNEMISDKFVNQIIENNYLDIARFMGFM